MVAAGEPDNTRLPGTVFTPRQVRLLKIAVIVMGLLLVGGFALVMASIVYQASRLGQSAAPGAAPSPAGETDLSIPKDAELGTLSLDGNRLALQLKSPGGTEIVVIDLRTGTVLSRVRLKPE